MVLIIKVIEVVKVVKVVEVDVPKREINNFFLGEFPSKPQTRNYVEIEIKVKHSVSLPFLDRHYLALFSNYVRTNGGKCIPGDKNYREGNNITGKLLNHIRNAKLLAEKLGILIPYNNIDIPDAIWSDKLSSFGVSRKYEMNLYSSRYCELLFLMDINLIPRPNFILTIEISDVVTYVYTSSVVIEASSKALATGDNACSLHEITIRSSKRLDFLES